MIVFLLAAGAALRLLYLCTPELDSDQAIYGLMARSILEGERPIFQWGFLYMGALEPYTAALWMLLIGPGRLALSLAPASYSMVSRRERIFSDVRSAGVARVSGRSP